MNAYPKIFSLLVRKDLYSEFIMSDMKCSFILDIDWTTLQGIEFVEYMTCLLLLFLNNFHLSVLLEN